MIRVYENPDEARGILNRRQMSTVEDVPDVVLDGIKRVFGEALTPEAAVARLLADVRTRGDAALREWTARIDGVASDILEVPQTEWETAYQALDADLRAALETSAGRIRDFHARQPIPNWTTDAMGGILGQRLVPLERVGVYVPGGGGG